MKKFSAIIEIIGANPFVSLPERVLAAVLREAGKDKGPIRVRGTINGDAYRQTLLRYKGAWRLYVNGFMLKNSPRRIGEKIVVQVDSFAALGDRAVYRVIEDGGESRSEY